MLVKLPLKIWTTKKAKKKQAQPEKVARANPELLDRKMLLAKAIPRDVRATNRGWRLNLTNKINKSDIYQDKIYSGIQLQN